MHRRLLRVILCLLTIVAVATFAQNPATPKRIVLRVGTVLDGTGGFIHNTRIVIEGSRIVAIDSESGPVDYDLSRFTVMPGWIDAHVHITWSFGPDGKNANQSVATPEATIAAANNARLTLLAGFTTVQSVGTPGDVPLRDEINKGLLSGPRILTANDPIAGRGPATGTPEELRAFVRKQKYAGADVIKIYAAGGMRTGPATLSQEQLDAACDEAKKQGLRTVVHAMREAVRMATLAGCTQIEHGLGASEDDLKLMAERGTFLDPQGGLLVETYIQFKEKYAGSPFYPATPEGFAGYAELLPIVHDFFKRAAKIPGLKIVFGTDAVAGAHGHNAEEFIDRVRDCGVAPLDALVSANSLAAKALGLSDQIGFMGVGHEADIIALDGDPLKDITAVRRVVFVMKGGGVYKNVHP